jgi:hypothetical protein
LESADPDILKRINEHLNLRPLNEDPTISPRRDPHLRGEMILRYVETSDEGGTAIDDAHLAVVAMIEPTNHAAPRGPLLTHSPTLLPPPPLIPRRFVKDPHKDPGLPRSLSVVASETGRTDAIDQETNDDTPTRRSSKHLKEPLSRSVRGEDVKLHIHAYRRRVDSGLESVKKKVAVVQNLTPLPHHVRRYLGTGSGITGRSGHERVFSS